MGERIQNVKCKCQLKITRELQKVRFEGADIFLTGQSLSGEAAHKHDGMGTVSSLHTRAAKPLLNTDGKVLTVMYNISM